jgi:hypothetical protein
VVYAPGVPNTQSSTSNDFSGLSEEAIFTRYYQGYNIARLRITDGRTMYYKAPGAETATYHPLTANEFANAFRCFSNIWTFAPVKNLANGEEDVSDLLMAYEFGISSVQARDLTITHEGKSESVPYLIFEVKVINRLAEVFGEDLPGARNTADFQPNTTISFNVTVEDYATQTTHAIDATDFTEVAGFDVTALTPPTTHTAGVRYFAIPFTDANFPLGTTGLKAHIKRTDLPNTP